MMKRSLLLIVLLYLCVAGFAYKVNGVYPTHWWVGMKNPNLQLMVHGANVQPAKFTVSYPGVKLVKVTKSESNTYAFLDFVISPNAKPGKMKIHVSSTDGDADILYELKPRNKDNGKLRVVGVTSEDLVYLIMPDRFANGDAANDNLPGFRERVVSRDSLKGRHGGDLQGVQQHLDY